MDNQKNHSAKVRRKDGYIEKLQYDSRKDVWLSNPIH